MLEARVHDQLREFLRACVSFPWAHHLTMARIVSRALRLQRSALIQTGSSSQRYCLSYLLPIFLSDSPVVLATTPTIKSHLLDKEIPRLQEWLTVGNIDNLMLTTHQDWLEDYQLKDKYFPQGIPTLIDGACDLVNWGRALFSAQMGQKDWEYLQQQYPDDKDVIRDLRIRLTKSLYHHPKNPYECYLLGEKEGEALASLLAQLTLQTSLPPTLLKFSQQWWREGQMCWASLQRDQGQFMLHAAPVTVANTLAEIWHRQPIVLMDSFLDQDKEAKFYRQQLGFGEALCLKFVPSRQNECIQLYLPKRLPLPNTPQFQGRLLEEVRALLHFCSHIPKVAVVLVEDNPLKAQISSHLAAEFGSRIQVEKKNLAQNSILISRWQFWQENQANFPTPQLLIIATLPIPSLENPLVAARVGYLKKQRQDWFRGYLLPAALQEIQRAVIPLRESKGVVAILDNRVNSRSYGKQILQVISPYARINYIEPSWFGDRLQE